VTATGSSLRKYCFNLFCFQSYHPLYEHSEISKSLVVTSRPTLDVIIFFINIFYLLPSFIYRPIVKWPLVVITTRSFPRSWLVTGFVNRVTRRVSLVEQELLILPEHLHSPPVFSGVRVTRSLVLCVCFVNRSLSFCTFSFDHCVVCSSIYRFWLLLWYLQTLLIASFYWLIFFIYS